MSRSGSYPDVSDELDPGGNNPPRAKQSRSAWRLRAARLFAFHRPQREAARDSARLRFDLHCAARLSDSEKSISARTRPVKTRSRNEHPEARRTRGRNISFH